MKYKKNRGYVAIDASIAILALLIIVPTLVGMIYNVNKTNNLIDRKTEAISIAINTIEIAKGESVTDLTVENVKIALKEIYPDLDEEELTLTKNDNTYKITINIQDYASTEQGKAIDAVQDKVKIVTAKVTFKSGKEDKNIELSTVIS